MSEWSHVEEERKTKPEKRAGSCPRKSCESSGRIIGFLTALPELGGYLGTSAQTHSQQMPISVTACW